MFAYHVDENVHSNKIKMQHSFTILEQCQYQSYYFEIHWKIHGKQNVLEMEHTCN